MQKTLAIHDWERFGQTVQVLKWRNGRILLRVGGDDRPREISDDGHAERRVALFTDAQLVTKLLASATVDVWFKSFVHLF